MDVVFMSCFVSCLCREICRGNVVLLYVTMCIVKNEQEKWTLHYAAFFLWKKVILDEYGRANT